MVCFELEFMESFFVGDVDVVLKKLDMFCEIGFKFVIDDFGIGLFSLMLLKKFLMICLKID